MIFFPTKFWWLNIHQFPLLFALVYPRCVKSNQVWQKKPITKHQSAGLIQETHPTSAGTNFLHRTSNKPFYGLHINKPRIALSKALKNGLGCPEVIRINFRKSIYAIYRQSKYQLMQYPQQCDHTSEHKILLWLLIGFLRNGRDQYRYMKAIGSWLKRIWQKT